MALRVLKRAVSYLQALVEGLLKEYPNTLILRVRMPIVADMTYPRNFITKIIKYDKARASPARRIDDVYHSVYEPKVQ